jgi:glyceraldehyde-3-phosphate dehydrogenase/erythrose-4-phosphate dehydrogenase
VRTQVVGGDLLEAQGWHDAEWGFSSRMVDLVGIIASDD